MAFKKKKMTALDLLCKLIADVPRERLMAEIRTGLWFFGGHRVYNPKALFDAGIKIEKQEDLLAYVSRGGLKLEQALEDLQLIEKVKGKVLLDLGASTGGFSECLLRKGARLVYACDVGSNQLDWSLRKDPRVICLEKTNAMSIPSLALNPKPSWAVCDISFRSSVSVAKAILPVLQEEWMLVLVKPQFEWLKAPSTYRGIVPLEEYPQILSKVGARLQERDIYIEKIVPSVIKGKKQGNQEFFFLLSLKEDKSKDYTLLVEQALGKAFKL